jgi:hypothetical protein
MTTKITLPPIEVLASSAAALVEAAGDNRSLVNALNKAALHLHEGLAPVATVGGFLVSSGTRGGIVHRFSSTHGCTCEAGSRGRVCWHAQLIAIIEDAQSRAIEIASARRVEIEKQVVYRREDRDFDAYVVIDGARQYIGSRLTRIEAERLCDDYVFDYYADSYTPEKAAAVVLAR